MTIRSIENVESVARIYIFGRTSGMQTIADQFGDGWYKFITSIFV